MIHERYPEKNFEDSKFLAKIEFYYILGHFFSKICPKFSKTATTAPNFRGFAPEILPPIQNIGGAGLPHWPDFGGQWPPCPLIFAPDPLPIEFGQGNSNLCGKEHRSTFRKLFYDLVIFADWVQTFFSGYPR